MNVIANMVARLGWQVDDKALVDTEQQLGDVEDAAVSLGKSLKWAAGAAGFLTATAGATWAWTQAAATAGDEAGKSARMIGVTAEAYQELSYAANQNGVATNDMRTAILKLGKAATSAASGNAELGKAFASLGINAQEFAALAPDQQFERLADALAGVEDQGLRTSLSMKLLEEAGPKFASLFEDGSKNIREMREEARALGLVMSEQATLDAEEFSTQMSRVSAMVMGLRNTIGVELFPVVNELVDEFRGWFEQNREILRQGISEFLRRAVRLFRVLAGVVSKVVGWTTKLVDSLGGVERVGALVEAVLIGIGARAVLVGISAVVAKMKALSLAATIAQIKIYAIVALFALIALVVEDVFLFFTDGESALGDFVDKFKESEGFLGSLARGVAWLKSDGGPAIRKFGEDVIGFFSRTGDKVSGIWDWLTNAISSGIEWAGDTIDRVITRVGDVFGGVMDVMTGAWNAWFGGIVTGLGTIARGIASAGAFLGDKLGLDTEGIRAFADSMESLQGRGQAQQMRGLSTAYQGAQRAAGVTQNVGAVEVTIAGSTSMGAGEVSAAVERGVNRGLTSEVDQLARLTQAGA